MSEKDSQPSIAVESVNREVMQNILLNLDATESVAIILNRKELVAFTHMLACVPLGHHLSRPARQMKRDLMKLHKITFGTDTPDDPNAKSNKSI
jgi:hypothetical protein